MESKRAPTVSLMKERSDVNVKLNGARHLKGYEEMKLHGQWRKQRDAVASIDVAKSDAWLKYAYLTPETESILCAAQEQTLATNYVRNKIWKADCSPMCRLCREHPETINHIVSGCKCLAGTKYTVRHDKIGTYIHWCILREMGVQVCEEWFKHTPEKTVEHEGVIVMWDLPIITGKNIGANRPDITIHDKNQKKALLIDFSVPCDINIVNKTAEKLTKYKELEVEIQKCWNLKKVTIVPIIVGALGAVSTDHAQYLKLIPGKIEAKIVQKTALLGTANILRSVLSMDTPDEKTTTNN